jgi:hypothetical protein
VGALPLVRGTPGPWDSGTGAHCYISGLAVFFLNNGPRFFFE